MDNYILYGITFWTHISSTDEISDYKKINKKQETPYGIRTLKVSKDDINKLSIHQLQKLINFIKSNNSKNIIIITHFPPFRFDTNEPQHIKEYFGHDWNKIKNDFITTDNKIIWISGHIHQSYNFIKDDILFYGNYI